MARQTMSEPETSDWHARAEALQEHGDVSPRRAQAVALREQGLTYREIAAQLDVKDHSSIRKQIKDYEADYREAEWLVENGPSDDDL